MHDRRGRAQALVQLGTALPARAVQAPGADDQSHWDGILNAFDSRLNNGGVDATSGLIQAANACTQGYRTARNLITLTYLSRQAHPPAGLALCPYI